MNERIFLPRAICSKLHVNGHSKSSPVDKTKQKFKNKRLFLVKRLQKFTRSKIIKNRSFRNFHENMNQTEKIMQNVNFVAINRLNRQLAEIRISFLPKNSQFYIGTKQVKQVLQIFNETVPFIFHQYFIHISFIFLVKIALVNSSMTCCDRFMSNFILIGTN